MSLLQSLQLEHLPEGYTAHLAMFHDVKNAGFLHEQLLAGNSEFEYAFVDASIVCAQSPCSRDCYSPPSLPYAHLGTTVHLAERSDENARRFTRGGSKAVPPRDE